MKPWLGILGLFSSRKGTLLLILIAVSGALAAMGKLEPTFGVVAGVVSTIYCFVQGRLDQHYNTPPFDPTNRNGAPPNV